MYTTFGMKIIKNEKENEQDENEPNDKDKEEEMANTKISENDKDKNDDEHKFHFIITNSEDNVPLPKIIEIHDPYLGEPKWMRTRKHPAALRHHKIRKEEDYESWMLNELLLYTLGCSENH